MEKAIPITEDQSVIDGAEEVYVYHRADNVTYSMVGRGQSQGTAIILPDEQFYDTFEFDCWVIPHPGYPREGEHCMSYRKRGKKK